MNRYLQDNPKIIKYGTIVQLVYAARIRLKLKKNGLKLDFQTHRIGKHVPQIGLDPISGHVYSTSNLTSILI